MYITSCHGSLLISEREQTIDSGHRSDGPEGLYAKWNKSWTQKATLMQHRFPSTALWKQQSYRDRGDQCLPEDRHGWERLAVKRVEGGVLGNWLVLYCDDGVGAWVSTREEMSALYVHPGIVSGCWFWYHVPVAIRRGCMWNTQDLCSSHSLLRSCRLLPFTQVPGLTPFFRPSAELFPASCHIIKNKTT